MKEFTIALLVHFIEISKYPAHRSAFLKKVQKITVVKSIEGGVSKMKKKRR